MTSWKMLAALAAATLSAQLMPKAQVANLIVRVENGVDEFRDYLERRGDNAKETASTQQSSARRAEDCCVEAASLALSPRRSR